MAMTHHITSVQAANGFHVLPTRFHRAKYLEPMTLESSIIKGWTGATGCRRLPGLGAAGSRRVPQLAEGSLGVTPAGH